MSLDISIMFVTLRIISLIVKLRIQMYEGLRYNFV